ncbi:hypothetical protein CHU98_g3288 [Xylaria longipes]|nr:hypothetical protein CHU98_g3288 [Xylaria longipes]
MSTEFNTEIFKANLSNPLDIQYDWATSPAACLRPTADFGIPIVCKVTKYTATSYLLSLGTEYDAFAKCCNRTLENANATQWILIDPCLTEYCFTDDQALATNFDQCIVNTATDELKKQGINATRDSYRGRCEWIDYDSIKKGVRSLDELSSAAGLVLPWLALGTALAAALLTIS